jgi:hypothetical protein
MLSRFRDRNAMRLKVEDGEVWTEFGGVDAQGAMSVSSFGLS